MGPSLHTLSNSNSNQNQILIFSCLIIAFAIVLILTWDGAINFYVISNYKIINAQYIKCILTSLGSYNDTSLFHFLNFYSLMSLLFADTTYTI